MKRIIILCSLFISIALGLRAEGELIGYLNKDSLFATLDEVNSIEEKVLAAQVGYENEYKLMKVDYNKKVKDYIEKNASLPESIKLARQSEITEAEKRITLYKQRYTEELNKTRSELLAPVKIKYENAIRTVATEKGLLMVMDKKDALFTSPKCIDITNLVAEQLKK